MGLFKPNIERMRYRRNLYDLEKALNHKNFIVRKEAIKTLEKIGETISALELIIVSKNDDREELKRKAKLAYETIKKRKEVGNIRDSHWFSKGYDKRTNLLKRNLNQNDLDTRKKVIESLGDIGDTYAAKSLLREINLYSEKLIHRKVRVARKKIITRIKKQKRKRILKNKLKAIPFHIQFQKEKKNMKLSIILQHLLNLKMN